MVKNLLAVQETWIQSLDWEDPLEKGVAPHSSILAWRIPWTKEPGRLQSMELQIVYVLLKIIYAYILGFPGGLDDKESTYNVRD